MTDHEYVPIVIGNCAPFRLILRDEDKWDVTLKDINTMTYDYVKLNRNSTEIDVDIRPLSLIIGFDGSLILPNIPPFNNREGAAFIYNRFLGTLLLGGIYSEAVHPDDISFGHMIFEGYNYIDGGGHGEIAKFHETIRYKMLSELDIIELYQPSTITVKELHAAYKQGRSLYQKLYYLSANLLLEGISDYVASNWTQSVILLWTAIEQLINQIWEDQIISKANHKKRKEFLNDFRTWTAAAKIETLNLLNILPSETYQIINDVRKARNDFMHRIEFIDKQSGDMALEALFHLMSLITSNYTNTSDHLAIRDMIMERQRGVLYSSKKINKEDIKCWHELPPLPGSKQWGDKPFEIIEELRLQKLPDNQQQKIQTIKLPKNHE